MSDELKRRFEDLITYIDKANEDISNGQARKLSALDKTVTALCRDMEDAEKSVANDMQPIMAELISKLDELERNLTEFQQRQEGEKP